MLELNKIHLGDSYELIKYIPDKSIDLVIIDPPYEMKKRGASFHGKKDYFDEINEKDLDKGINVEILNEIVRVMKKVNLYIFVSKDQFKMMFNYFGEYKMDILVWHKSNPIPTINDKYLSDLEYILFIREKGVIMNNTYETSSKLFQTSVNKDDKNEFSHPTIKPLEIIKKLIINSSIENDLVLDCFSGSGTTCVACKELNRQFIGIEIDEKYHNISVDRLNGINVKGQTSIFTDFDTL